jgi:integrase
MATAARWSPAAAASRSRHSEGRAAQPEASGAGSHEGSRTDVRMLSSRRKQGKLSETARRAPSRRLGGAPYRSARRKTPLPSASLPTLSTRRDCRALWNASLRSLFETPSFAARSGRVNSVWPSSCAAATIRSAVISFSITLTLFRLLTTLSQQASGRGPPRGPPAPAPALSGALDALAAYLAPGSWPRTDVESGLNQRNAPAQRQLPGAGTGSRRTSPGAGRRLKTKRGLWVASGDGYRRRPADEAAGIEESRLPHPGIVKRHSKRCRSCNGDRCNCQPTYEAWVYSKRDGKKIARRFTREAEAKSWRADALSALSKGGLRAPKRTTIREAWQTWYEAATEGTVRNRSGDRYKPSAIRSYERAMRLRVLPELSAVRLADLRRADLQEFADGLLANGLNPSTIQGTLLPLRAIFRRALAHGELAVNPCNGLILPAVRGRRERYSSPQEAEALLAALPSAERPLWAAALYAGLRCGELQALRDRDIDLAAGLIRVERGWDFKEGPIDLKSRAGRRRVPIADILRDHLAEQRMRAGRQGDQLYFGRTPSDPFRPGTLQKRADDAWEAAGLERITYHECRHTFASLMIAAGVNAKALSTFMGHANISITLDRYGHLMPGSEAEAAGLLDAYLTAQRREAAELARSAGDSLTGALSGARLGVEG